MCWTLNWKIYNIKKKKKNETKDFCTLAVSNHDTGRYPIIVESLDIQWFFADLRKCPLNMRENVNFVLQVWAWIVTRGKEKMNRILLDNFNRPRSQKRLIFSAYLIRVMSRRIFQNNSRRMNRMFHPKGNIFKLQAETKLQVLVPIPYYILS